MKKSYDYFKTLKEMSVAVGDAYLKMVTAKDFNKEVICFSGLKWELTGNLFNEFVAPIERNDIYHLTLCLSDELYFISKLNNVVSLIDIKCFNFVDSLNTVFAMQNKIFNDLFDIKNYDKSFIYINETKAVLNGVNSSVVLSIKNCLLGSDKPLLKYSVISGFYDIYKAIEQTLSETQRVVINNN